MKILYTKEQFNQAKNNNKLPLECYNCHDVFYKIKSDIVKVLNGYKNVACKFCSRKCMGQFIYTQKSTICKNCNKTVKKSVRHIKKSKSGNLFCNSSCAASYNNKHKTYGTRRSKLEIYICQRLKEDFPQLEVYENRRDIIDSELDIYLPQLRLAIELNGIFHYEPIYGKDNLIKIKNNDRQKIIKCYEAGIELLVIDTTNQKYFKESTSKKYYDIIKNIITDNLQRVT